VIPSGDWVNLQTQTWHHQCHRQHKRKMHRHLRRLDRVWIDWPIYFITTCTLGRRAILASKEVSEILIDEWRNGRRRHGWAVGRYVIMPDHVHLFCRAELGAKALPGFAQRWKEWSSKRMARELNFSGRVWQEEFTFCVLVRATVKSGITLRRIRCGPGSLRIQTSGRGRVRSNH
jgi:putative transposase